MELKHVAGKKKRHIVLYALSTCAWCKKTRKLLESIGADYYFTYVDLLEGKDREDVEETVARWNPNGSFPTIVIDEQEVIAGFDEEKVRKVLES
jgi:glutaredoxin